MRNDRRLCLHKKFVPTGEESALTAPTHSSCRGQSDGGEAVQHLGMLRISKEVKRWHWPSSQIINTPALEPTSGTLTALEMWLLLLCLALGLAPLSGLPFTFINPPHVYQSNTAIPHLERFVSIPIQPTLFTCFTCLSNSICFLNTSSRGTGASLSNHWYFDSTVRFDVAEGT